MEEDILNYLLAVMFRRTPCSFENELKFTKSNKNSINTIQVHNWKELLLEKKFFWKLTRMIWCLDVSWNNWGFWKYGKSKEKMLI